MPPPSIAALRRDEVWIDPPPPRAGDPTQVVVAYPHTYPVAMASLSFLTLLRLTQQTHACSLERAFFYPAKVTAPQGHRNGATFETGAPIKDADLLALSCAFENDYFHIGQLLAAAGLPVRATERRGGPYVLVGGVAPSTNPLPLIAIADAIFLGEAEATYAAGLAVIQEYQSALRSRDWAAARDAINAELATLPGFFVPAIHRTGESTFATVDYATVEHFESAPSYSSVLSPHTAYAGMNLIEIGRGCPRFCKFCLTGFIHTATRWKTPEAILDSAERALPHATRVGLIAAIPSQHPRIAPVLEALLARGLEFSLSSQSFSSLTDTVMPLLVQGGMETLTIGLETYDEHVQKRLGKFVPYAKLQNTLRTAASLGIRRFRAYIMIGLPEEEPDTCDHEIVAKTIDLRDLLQAHLGGKFELALSINPFIPKPLTPWEAHPMLPTKVFEARIHRIQAALRRERDIDLKFESPRESWVQAILSSGGIAEAEWLATNYSASSPYQALRAAQRDGSLALASSIHIPRPERMASLLSFINRGADPVGEKLRREEAAVLAATIT